MVQTYPEYIGLFRWADGIWWQLGGVAVSKSIGNIPTTASSTSCSANANHSTTH